jgi:hypothetical protein
MSDSGDVVRRVTITANGQGIGSTTGSVNAPGDAFDKASDSGNAFSSLAVGLAGLGPLLNGASSFGSFLMSILTCKSSFCFQSSIIWSVRPMDDEAIRQ